MSETYQDRVIQERDQLADRISNLSNFISSDVFSGLIEAEQCRLRLQAGVMDLYIKILNARIDAFEAIQEPRG